MIEVVRSSNTVTVFVPKEDFKVGILSELPFNVEISYGFDTVRITYVSSLLDDDKELLLLDLYDKEELILSFIY